MGLLKDHLKKSSNSNLYFHYAHKIARPKQPISNINLFKNSTEAITLNPSPIWDQADMNPLDNTSVLSSS